MSSVCYYSVIDTIVCNKNVYCALINFYKIISIKINSFKISTVYKYVAEPKTEINLKCVVVQILFMHKTNTKEAIELF